ncbi:SDR family NAD(P)-dependent oxidoreductase [Caballeronia ptereochthonis]|uniref:Short-chain dehydrogenase/reductase SDR n=1 Tax=Caballeronia ptereochthonis TaxID=1777144 RepID=A0A157Z347_9BURK|nr:glucose 1-dehydrogenase [Caballeronia ptereochthonis]SAK39980.1 short-chain dehydrogenase/reductase SDR [Caballeronia ptereochthonis]
MASQLNGKVALVTGGSSGIGLATAKRFAAEGAIVYITGRKQDALDKAVAEIGGKVVAIRADSSIVADLERVYATIRDKSGRLDVLFANAGIAAFVPLPAITEEHYDSIVDTNLKGVVFTVKYAVPLLSEGASIILTSSTAGYKGMEAFSVYSATKAAIRQLARGWLLDLKAKKIRVNVISPGMVDTPAIDGLVGDPNAAAGMKAHVASQIPLGRIAQPGDIAAVAVFLSSDEAAYINGVELPVDGGASQI